MDALREVMDPEQAMNLVELGLIYDIEMEGACVRVQMTLTSPGCPLSNCLVGGVEARLMMLEGVEEVEIQLVWDPPWNPTAIG